MIETDLYPVFVNLSSQRALVVGDDDIAAEKADALRAAGAEVEMVRPQDYETERLTDKLLVVAATSDVDLARRIHDDATARTMLVNVADVPELCNFILPAITRSGPITVAVSTAGASPALAQRIRGEVAAVVGEHHATLAELLDGLRPWAKENLPTYESRRDFFAGIVTARPDPIELLATGRRDELIASIEAAQAAATTAAG